ncbi:MAG: DUF4082 domain-containing protein [Terrimonas sp.]|nr:DUF4082 domain-containing protein [Terrimonas sp.]OJY87792.1 MAG: hypothetical protein BGP13_05020 [Sphingobacteriales bacterium 40-81]
MKKFFTQPMCKTLLCLHAILLSFAFIYAQPSNPNDGPGGPILVISNTSNPFSRYMVEILRAEGLNAFAATDITAVTESGLNNYDVAILGEMQLDAGQVTMLSNWVNNGGTLITMRPDAQLQSLLGITLTAGNLPEAYLLVNTSEGPGVGIVNQTMQYHGTADLYMLNGATALATLYADAATATANPAVTTHNVGANGGRAVSFTYDLAKSVVYTRQGNPLWAGDERDGQSGPIRSNDMFYGAKTGDIQPDWIDFNKIAIPQADEQQRLLTNIIIQSNFHRKPLPRFWFLPRGLKAAIVMSGDDHGTGGTAGRFDRYLALSPQSSSTADWTAIRGTSYIFPNTPITKEQVTAYQAQGFEIGLHVNTNCDNWTPTSLDGFITNQKATLLGNLSNINPIVTNRTHCIAWSDWASEAEVEADHGIRLDVNYYYWPASWVQNRPGMFTGSGMPMRFAKTDGALIDCYQVPTQMTDESGIDYSSFCNALLDKALGAEGYYGVFCANMHTDLSDGPLHAGSEAIIASALVRQVPVISAKQMLTWLDGRNNSSFGITSWDNNELSFSITAAEGANFLQAMLPKYVNNLKLNSITRNGVPVSFTSQMIKGMEYGFYEAATGDYIANYAECVAPTATITATSPVCQGEPVKLTLASATGVAPFNIIVNGVTYTGVHVGDEFASFSASETSVWGNTGTPDNANATDNEPIEVGVKFRSAVNGYVTGVRFYKGSGNGGTNNTHIGKLWSADGSALLASATFTNETESGWQEVRFATPVYITANTTYVASYYSPSGYFAYTSGGLTNAVSNSSLTALSAGTDGPNGVFKYGGGFPNDPLSSNANYWADVLFSEVTSSGSPIDYVLTSITDAGDCNNTGAALSTATVTVNALPSGSLLPVTPVCTGEEVFLNFNAATGAAPYTLVINGETFNNINHQTAFNTHIQAPLNDVHTIWDASTTGGTQNVDEAAVELGVRFTSTDAGYIAGIRFYKTDNVIRTYTGNLWDPVNPVSPLATATLTTDNTIGWKQINFASPVAINANITYVASYFSPGGHYAYTAGGLNNNVVNAPLTALAGSVFTYSGGYPTNSSTANYWADVAFQTQATETINLTQITDANGCKLEGALQNLVLQPMDCSALPVTLTNLFATPADNSVKLTWQTASENNNQGFEIQRSTDGVQWTNIGFVNGAGNSNLLLSYSYNDNNLAPGRYYYRLRQVDLDGRFVFTKIVSVNLDGSAAGYALLQNYPNPFTQSTIIRYTLPQAGFVRLTLFDVNGKEVKVLVKRIHEKGTHLIELNNHGLSRGTYYYKMETSNFSATKKLIVL